MKTQIIHTFLGVLSILLSAPGAHAFYSPSAGKWLTRDPIGEQGFGRVALSLRTVSTQASVMQPSQYDFVANSPVNKLDFLGLSCNDPCRWARNHAGIENGVTVCCGGKKYACLIFSGGSSGTTTDPTARRVIDACVIAHEQVHVKDPNKRCPEQCLWKHPTYGDWGNPDPDTRFAGECAAYWEEKDCLELGRLQCAGSPACEAQIDAELDHVRAKLKEQHGCLFRKQL
jgi:hypothetical protein